MIEQSSLIAAVRALARASRAVERAADGLSLADCRVMAAVSDGEERASRLAKRLAVGKPAISATVDSLCRRGLMQRQAVESDGRANSLVLTDAGRELFDRTEARMARQLELLAERTDDPDAVVSALAALGDAIELAVAERQEREARV